MAVSEDENLIRNLVKEIRGVLAEEGLPNIPIVLEEWSNNVWQRDLCNDTCYKSAYLFKNILENNSGLNAMGYFITCPENEIQIFLYHYCHYDLLYRYRHVINMNRINRYQVFVPKNPQAFYIRFENMEAGQYEIRRYGITREGGSSYDIWVKMGAPEPINPEEKEMLKDLSRPVYRRESLEVKTDGTLNIKASLNPLDVWLIKIKIS